VRSYDDIDAAMSERKAVSVPIQGGGSFAQALPLREKLKNIKKELLGLTPDADGFTRALSLSRLSLSQSKSAAQLHRNSEYSVNSLLNRCFHQSSSPLEEEHEFECCGNCGSPNDGCELYERGMWTCTICGFLNGSGPGVIGASSVLDRCIEEVTQDAHTDAATVHSSTIGNSHVLSDLSAEIEASAARRQSQDGMEFLESTKKPKKRRSRKKSKDAEGENTEGKKPAAKEREPSPHPTGPITTLMLRNIPNKYSQSMLRGALDEDFKHGYDFLYLPIDFKNRCNIGYAFINFTDELTAQRFREKFQGLHLTGFNSTKVCDVSTARVQGLEANVQHYKNSPVCALPVEEYRPIIIGCDPTKPNELGQTIPFPSPDATPQPIKLRGSRSRAARRGQQQHQPEATSAAQQ
ncbi:hypothetical protein FOL47_006737, partial [Perkinsus chesapeaki]